jgi:hypothetical protein
MNTYLTAPSFHSQPNHPQGYQDTKLLQAVVYCTITKNHVNVIYIINTTLYMWGSNYSTYRLKYSGILKYPNQGPVRFECSV